MDETKVRQLPIDIPDSKMRMEIKARQKFSGEPAIWMDFMMGRGIYEGTFSDQRFVIDGAKGHLTITLFYGNGCNVRQYLDRNGMKALLPYLQRFVETGELVDAAELAAIEAENPRDD